MYTHENKFIALSRLSSVAIASANEISDTGMAKVELLTYNMVVILLYTELNPCSRIGVLLCHRTVSPSLYKPQIICR